MQVIISTLNAMYSDAYAVYASADAATTQPERDRLTADADELFDRARDVRDAVTEAFLAAVEELAPLTQASTEYMDAVSTSAVQA